MKIIHLVASCLFLLGLAIGLTVQSETLDCHHFTACSVSQVNENGVTGTQVDYEYQGCMGGGGFGYDTCLNQPGGPCPTTGCSTSCKWENGVRIGYSRSYTDATIRCTLTLINARAVGADS